MSLLKEKLREILNSPATRDLVESLERLLEKLIVELRPLKIIIAGSLAKKRFVRGLSDIDILVVVDYNIPRDEKFTLISLRDVDVEITIISKRELEEALRENREFYVDTIKHGIVVFAANPLNPNHE